MNKILEWFGFGAGTSAAGGHGHYHGDQGDHGHTHGVMDATSRRPRAASGPSSGPLRCLP